MGKIDESLPLNNSYFPVIVLSTVFLSLTYNYLNPWMSRKLCTGYRNLTVELKNEWNSSLNAFMLAILLSLTCGYNFIFDSELSKDTIWWDSWLVRAECAVYIGLTIVDTIAIITNYKYFGSIVMISHHVVSIIAYFYIVTFGPFLYYANYRLMAEFSTPMVAMRWFLDTLGYKRSSKPFIINAVLLLGAFFACRVACIPHFWYKVYEAFNKEDEEKLGALVWICIAVCIILDAINCFWFYKILSAAKKVFGNSVFPEKDQRHKAVKIE